MVNDGEIIKNCRLCFSAKLNKIINFGKVALGNNLHNSFTLAEKAKTYPLIINRCADCGHFQLSYSVNPIDLYAKNYTYTSSVGASFVKHLEVSANDILDYNKEKNVFQKILDVGSNDGSALTPFKEKNNSVLGVDPAQIPSQIANKKGIETINSFFSKSLSEKIKNEYGLFDIVISHNVLAHVENLHDVFDGINNVLKTKGLLVFEIGYFKSLIKNNIYDTIYHEHLDYHTKRPLCLFLNKMGFEVEKISENNIQGGSLRFYCRKNKSPKSLYFHKYNLNDEITFFKDVTLKTWEMNIHSNISKIKKIILDTKKKGANIYGFGAPTKATLVVNLLGDVAQDISFIVDDNPLKLDKYMSVNPIKIQSNLPSNMSKNDVIICFAWNFYDEIFIKLQTKKIKGKFFNINNGESRNL